MSQYATIGYQVLSEALGERIEHIPSDMLRFWLWFSEEPSDVEMTAIQSAATQICSGLSDEELGSPDAVAQAVSTFGEKSRTSWCSGIAGAILSQD